MFLTPDNVGAKRMSNW